MVMLLEEKSEVLKKSLLVILGHSLSFQSNKSFGEDLNDKPDDDSTP
jgi:hypothetical protein